MTASCGSEFKLFHALGNNSRKDYNRPMKMSTKFQTELFAMPFFFGKRGTVGSGPERGDTGRCSKYSNYLPPYFLIGIVNFPNGNLDNFDLRPAGLMASSPS
jgi:hypothetical protein